MTATRLWMIGCLAFAGLSAYLAVDLFGTGFNNYAEHIRCNFVSAQRDVLFKLIPELRPRLQADQIETAAMSAKISTQRDVGIIRALGGIEFVLAGIEITSIRSSNY